MGPSVRRTLNGALAGSAATALWAAQQPLDMRAFGVRYSDTELLGKFVTRTPGWRPLGVAMHVLGGAAFGALYARVAPRLPVSEHARGPLLAMVEHLSSWPLTRFIGRAHPAAGDLPPLWGDHAAFAQATWRHLILGVVCGELERWLNGRGEGEPPRGPGALLQSLNGHRAATELRLAGRA